ncbi:DUF4192 domain-containing protein [Mycobacterium sp. PS03-16]|uniref:DUF4192 domain-containing protein n=1 Tax=Mycobacterium sp. PS03-16 TaxID=2559611 RepID=UPI0010731904|nr:DUF4192 domain-containing protein [Mycobacterium sp. PS03-16]TFV55643.1 DUF4192 domain-containing protein [Mycobacterium sp. PS03-16]
MTNSQLPDVPLDRPGSLIAALPAVLGFVPEASLVLLTVDRGELGCVLRIDLAADMTAAVEHLAEVTAAGRPDGAIAVVVDEHGADCHPCNDDHRELADDLAEELAAWGVPLLAAHVVDKVAAGGRWHCADGCGRGGEIDDPWSSPLAAAAVLDGRRLYLRRDELQAVVAADPHRSAALAPVLAATAVEMSDAEACAAIGEARAVAAGVADGRDPSDDEMVRLGAALRDMRVRDTLFALAVGEDADRAEALWVALARALPAPHRAEALVLLAFSAYARGDGPLAGVALDAALRTDAEHRMARMLDQALQSGMRPEQIRELAVTGYRVAEQLGVRLPPRRAVRRAG